MKKIALLLAVVLCVLAFAGCNNTTTEPKENSQSQSETESLPEESQPEEAGVERGTVADGVYSSTTLGISFTAPEDWAYMTDDEMATQYGATNEAFDLNDANLIYDMYAYAPAGTPTISINYENMGTIYGTLLDEDAYLTLSQSSITSAFEDAGLEVSFGEAYSESVGDIEFKCMDLVIGVNGEAAVYEKMLVKKCGDYMAIATIAAPSEEEVGNVSACIKAN